MATSTTPCTGKRSSTCSRTAVQTSGSRSALRARLDYREALDLEDDLELAVSLDGGRLDVGFVTPAGVKAVAAVEPLGAP
jgi:hypothetical protein